MRHAPIFFIFLASVAASHSALIAADAKPAQVTQAAAANAPGTAEWEPVRVALANDDPSAQVQLLALIKRYPTWADGTKALAKSLLDQGKTAEALAAARRASQLAPNDDQALRIQVRALADLGRKAEVYALVDSTATKDPTGWIRYDAGLAAVGFNDPAKAESWLKDAKSRAGSKIPAEFLFLESRIAILTRDFARAELALTSATSQQADFWDGWYELGRVRLVLADNDRAQRAAWIDKAGAAFSVVCKGVPDDANGHLGLGRTKLEEAKLQLGSNQNDQAGGKLREAIAQLDLAIAKEPDSAEAYVLLGDANVRLEQWAAAATALQRAKTLGAKDRSLTFNLAIALQQTGKNDEAQALLKSVTAASPAEQVTIGMGAYRSRNWLLAVQLLESAVEGLEDSSAKGATWRFIGHAYGHIADSKTSGKNDEGQNTARDAAAEAYRKAGDLLDFDARRSYLSSEAARSPEHAYAAAWQSIHWDTLNLSAWGLAIGNYGLAKTGGQGLGGMANRAPLHLALWGCLVVLPLIFFAMGLLRRTKKTGAASTPMAPRAARTGKPATSSVQPGPGKSPTRGQTSGSGTKSPLPRQPTRTTPRPELGGKHETAEIVNPAPRLKQKAETVSLYAPPAKAGNQPLVKPGLRRPSQIIPPSDADQTMIPTPSPDQPAQALERRRK